MQLRGHRAVPQRRRPNPVATILLAAAGFVAMSYLPYAPPAPVSARPAPAGQILVPDDSAARP
jgi:hypothetical protein